MPRGRKKRTESGGSQAAAPSSFQQIQITGKRVTIDDGSRHETGARLEVGADVSRETADLLIERGLAIDITGKLQAAIKEETAAADDRNRIVLQQQRAQTEMARFDALDDEERERIRYQDPEEGADIEDEEDPV